MHDSPSCPNYDIFVAACFYEFWKRQEAVIAWEWDLETDDTEEETRPEFEVLISKFTVPRDCKWEKVEPDTVIHRQLLNFLRLLL
jgi:hypothetical protein